MEDIFKYRFWDEEAKKMHHFDLFDTDEDIILGEDGPIYTNYNFDRTSQCTGLKDKNKELIYGGDIVKRQNRYIGIVIFESGCFKIEWQDGVYYNNARHIDDYQPSNLEIIGNIYQTPELLEA